MKTICNLFFLILVTTSCGKLKHEVRGVPTNYKIDAPDNFTLGPDFEKAAKFCDKRYGKNTQASEDCFQDYRNYTKLSIGINLDELTNFCYAKYNSEQDRTSCIDELIDLIKLLKQ